MTATLEPCNHERVILYGTPDGGSLAMCLVAGCAAWAMIDGADQRRIAAAEQTDIANALADYARDCMRVEVA